jgi:hypothetical protein
MIRLHEFITKIRNCKTIAEERAEYQKEMAAIRESFAVCSFVYLEKLGSPPSQKCDQAAVHQHVGARN